MAQNNAQNKRIVKNTIYLYVRTFFTMLISLYTSRIVFKVLGVDDYGIYNVVGTIAASFSFLSSTLSNATQRYLNFAIGENNMEKANKLFNMNFLIYLIYSVVAVIIIEVGGTWFIENKMVISPERVNAAYWVLHATSVTLFFSLLSSVYESVLIARENMKIYAYMGIYDAVAKLGIVFLISFLTVDRLILYGVLMALMSVSARMIPAVYSIRHYSETKLHFYWNREWFKDMFKFTGWNVMGTSVFILNDQGINMLLNMFFGPIVNTARGLSMQVKNSVTSFAMGFFTAVRPQIVKSYAAGETDRFIQLIFNSGKYTFYLLWLFSLPVLLRIDELLAIWLGNVPEWTSEFILWIFIFNLINCSLCDPLWQGIQAIGKMKNYVLYGSIIYSFAFPLSWMAFKMGHGPLAAFQIVVMCRVVYFICAMIIFRKYVEFSAAEYLKTVILPIVYVVVVSLFFSYLIDKCLPQDIVYTFISCAVTLIVVAISVLCVGVKKDERLLIINAVKKKICRF